jgi:hypothetical protein
MATVVFGPFIQQYVTCPPMEAPGHSVREVLENYFREFRRIRGYILDDRGRLRPRLTVYVDGAVIVDRVELSDPVHHRARVCVQPVLLDTEYDSL